MSLNFQRFSLRLCGVAVNAYLTMLLDTGVLHCEYVPYIFDLFFFFRTEVTVIRYDPTCMSLSNLFLFKFYTDAYSISEEKMTTWKS